MKDWIGVFGFVLLIAAVIPWLIIGYDHYLKFVTAFR